MTFMIINIQKRLLLHITASTCSINKKSQQNNAIEGFKSNDDVCVNMDVISTLKVATTKHHSMR